MPDSRRRRPRPAPEGSLSIGALSRATGIPVQTIRTWETRYDAPVAERKPSGHRLYAPETVRQLRRVARLIALGHRPADLFGRPEAALEELLRAAGAALEDSAAPPAPPRRRGSRTSTASQAAGTATFQERLRLATREFDRPALTGALRAAWRTHEPLAFLDSVAGAFLSWLGEAWRAGVIDIRHEHFASACVFDVLREVREELESRARGARVTAATLPGEKHEGGLLIASTLLAAHGWRVTYVGADTPVEEIAAAARLRGTGAVLISLSAASDPARTKRLLGRLRDALPRRMPLWLGGAGAPASVEGAESFGTLSDLATHLESRD